MKQFFVSLFMLFVVATAVAHAEKDYFSDPQTCLQHRLVYEPSIKRSRPMVSGEFLLPHPNGGCADEVLPDRLGGRGWIFIPSSVDIIDGKDGLRDSRCSNHEFAFIPADPPATPAPTPVASTPAPAGGLVVNNYYTQAPAQAACPNAQALVAQAQAGDHRKKDLDVKVECPSMGVEVAVNDFKPAKQSSGCGFGCGMGMVLGAVLAPSPVIVADSYGYGGGYNTVFLGNGGYRGGYHGGGHNYNYGGNTGGGYVGTGPVNVGTGSGGGTNTGGASFRGGSGGRNTR